MISYELAKKLKKVGFPQEGDGKYNCCSHGISEFHPDGNHETGTRTCSDEEKVYKPTLDELIEACNPNKSDHFGIILNGDVWTASYIYNGYFEHNNKFKQGDDIYAIDIMLSGSTPEEAVANLYIALHTK